MLRHGASIATRPTFSLASASSTLPCAPMPSNPRKHKDRAIYDNYTRRCAEQASEHVLETAEQTQCLLPGAELLLRHQNSCVTMTPRTAARNALGMLQLRRLWWPLRARSTCFMLHMLHAAHVAPSTWLYARRSRLRPVAKCLRTRCIRRMHSPFTALSVKSALHSAACEAKRCTSTQRISARLRRLGRFPVAIATRSHRAQILQHSCN